MAIPKAFITMSMRETDRLKIIQAVVDRLAHVTKLRRSSTLPDTHSSVWSSIT